MYRLRSAQIEVSLASREFHNNDISNFPYNKENNKRY